MANKDRVLFLLRLLQEQSDEERPLNTTEIRRAMEAEGCPATVQTIRNDIKTLRDAEIQIVSHERNGIATAYYYAGRIFEDSELQILIDAVSSAQFITRNKSNALIKKIAKNSGPSHRGELEPGILISGTTKAQNTQVLSIIQKIREGIRAERKISFKYYDYDLHLERVARHNGETYVVSPYGTVWKNDRYYLIGYSDRRADINAFRIDRMDTPRVTAQERVPEPETFSLKDFSEKKFKMFGGEDKIITLACRAEMINHIVDYFGRDVQLQNVREDYFEVTVPVSVSRTFFSWIMQYEGLVTILNPVEVRNEYEEMLRSALDHISQLITDGEGMKRT